MDVLWTSVDRFGPNQPNFSCDFGRHYCGIVPADSKDGRVYLIPIFALGFFCRSLKFPDLANELISIRAMSPGLKYPA